MDDPDVANKITMSSGSHPLTTLKYKSNSTHIRKLDDTSAVPPLHAPALTGFLQASLQPSAAPAQPPTLPWTGCSGLVWQNLQAPCRCPHRSAMSPPSPPAAPAAGRPKQLPTRLHACDPDRRPSPLPAPLRSCSKAVPHYWPSPPAHTQPLFEWQRAPRGMTALFGAEDKTMQQFMWRLDIVSFAHLV